MVISLSGRVSVAGILTMIFFPLKKSSLFLSIASIIASAAPYPFNISFAKLGFDDFIKWGFTQFMKNIISRQNMLTRKPDLISIPAN